MSGLAKAPLFAKLIVLAPSEAALTVNVAVGAAVVSETLAGVNVQPAAEGVTVTAEAAVLPVGDSDSVKAPDAAPVTPVLGPLAVMAVAGVTTA